MKPFWEKSFGVYSDEELTTQKSTTLRRALNHQMILLFTFFPSERQRRAANHQRHAGDGKGEREMVIAGNAGFGRGARAGFAVVRVCRAVAGGVLILIRCAV